MGVGQVKTTGLHSLCYMMLWPCQHIAQVYHSAEGGVPDRLTHRIDEKVFHHAELKERTIDGPLACVAREVTVCIMLPWRLET